MENRIGRSTAIPTSQARRVVSRAARIRELRESIARRALTTIGVPTATRITRIHRAGTVLIIATEDPNARWSPYAVDTFRIPTPDNTDPSYDTAGDAPKRWTPLAEWGSDDPAAVPVMLAKATAYAAEVQDMAVAA
jgi:hypothetical protein